MSKEQLLEDEILLYQTEDGQTRIDVRLANEDIWLTQEQMSELFQKEKSTLVEHIQNIYTGGKLNSEATIRKFRIVQKEGKREVARTYVLQLRRYHFSRLSSQIASRYTVSDLGHSTFERVLDQRFYHG